MSKLEELVNRERLQCFLAEHKAKKIYKVLIAIGIFATLIGVGYIIYRSVCKDGLDEYDDDYDDDFDDDFFDDEEEE